MGECYFWYWLTQVFPDKIHRAVKQLCVCGCVCACVCNAMQCIFSLLAGCHLSGKPGKPGKPGNVREFETCQGNVRDFVNSQGIVRGMSGKKSCQGKVTPKVLTIFAFIWVFSSIHSDFILCNHYEVFWNLIVWSFTYSSSTDMLWVPLDMGMSAAHCQGIVREMSGNFIVSGEWSPCIRCDDSIRIQIHISANF